MPGFPGLPRIDKLAGAAGGAIYDALTPRTNEPVGGPRPMGLSEYTKATASQFDPRSSAGLFNLATMLVPGMKGPGGKPMGRTPEQNAFMQAIFYGSRQKNPRAGMSFDPHDASVRALSEALANRPGSPGYKPPVNFPGAPIAPQLGALMRELFPSIFGGQHSQVNRVVPPAIAQAYTLNPNMRVTQPVMGQIPASAKMPDMQRGSFPPYLPGQAEHTFQTMPMPGQLEALMNEILRGARSS